MDLCAVVQRYSRGCRGYTGFRKVLKRSQVVRGSNIGTRQFQIPDACLGRVEGPEGVTPVTVLKQRVLYRGPVDGT